MRINSLIIGLTACFLIGGAAQADQIYTYTLDLPTIVAGAEVDSGFTQYPFSWTGPLMFNAAPNTACPTVCGPPLGTTVNAAYYFAGFTFTADLALSDAEVKVAFDQFSDPSQQIVFSFIEPDSFWSTTGTGITFPSSGGTGAEFLVTGGGETACTGCTIDISATAATPEPRSSLLLASLLVLFGILLPKLRKIRAQA